MSNYRKTMGQAMQEMYPINEDNMDLMRKAAGGAMQKIKMKDGKLQMDSFTASAIMQIYDKVNPANQKKMAVMINKGTKAGIMKLQDFAMKQVKSENDPEIEEEVDLDEAVKHMEVPPDGARGRGVPMAHPERIGYDSKENQQAYNSITHGTPDNQIATAKHFMKKGLKGKELHKAVADHHDVIHADVHKQLNHDKKKLHPLHMSFVGEDLDEGQEKGPKQLTNPNKEVMVVKKNKVIVINKKDQDKYLKQGWTLAEEVELDEALQAIVWKTKPPKGTRRVHPRSKWPGMKPDDIAKTWPSGKAGVEEVDLDEGSFIMTPKQAQALIDAKSDELRDRPRLSQLTFSPKELQDLVKKHKDLKDLFGKTAMKKGARYDTQKVSALADTGRKKGKYKTLGPDGKIEEELDLDEGKMSQLHQYIKDKKSPEEIAKLMKLDVKTIKSLMSSHHPEEVEESAASDARRAMRRDKDFSRRDSADDDTDATADDVKGASKNIMMQMRKAQSLNGRFDVEFGDGKKVKIPAKMAMAVQSKYNKMRRPAEKEKFQAKVGKSYRDMLSALKEEVKPKKESVLDRIDKKIKEKNDG
jgi:hypothetical protein